MLTVYVRDAQGILTVASDAQVTEVLAILKAMGETTDPAAHAQLRERLRGFLVRRDQFQEVMAEELRDRLHKALDN